MNLASYADHFMAVVTLLRAVPLTVGEGHGRDQSGTVLTAPYVTVETTSGPGFRGPVGARYDDGSMEIQTRCVATSARGVEVLRDQVATAMLGGVSVSGRSVQVWTDLSAGTTRDPDLHELFFGVDRWTLWSTPA